MKKVVHLLGAAMIAVALPAGALATAEAAVATTCSTGQSCVWEDPNYQTNGNTFGKLPFVQYIPHFNQWSYQGTSLSAHDNASSMHNHGTQQTVYYFKNDNCTGSSFSRGINQTDGDFTNGTPTGNFDNTLDSGAFSAFVGACLSAG